MGYRDKLNLSAISNLSKCLKAGRWGRRGTAGRWQGEREGMPGTSPPPVLQNLGFTVSQGAGSTKKSKT